MNGFECQLAQLAQTINFVGYEVTGQGHRIPNIDFEGLPRPPRAEVF